MRTFLYLLVFTLLVGCTNRQQKNDAQQSFESVKVAAYNVEYSKNASATEIGEALKPYNFDVVCFSEAPGGNWTKEVAKALGMEHTTVGKYSTAGHDDKYKTIVSRTPLYDTEEVLMADTLHTATRAKTKIAGTELALYSVHFPFGWRDQAHIDETTNKIYTFVKYLGERQADELAVVMGDFNFIPSNTEAKNMYHEMFIKIGLDITWKELGIDCTKRNTFNALKSEDEGSGEVIDHIMYNTAKMEVSEGEILEMEKPLSDHKPVWATLKLKN